MARAAGVCSRASAPTASRSSRHRSERARRRGRPRRLDRRVGARVRALGYSMNLSHLARPTRCDGSWDDWRHRCSASAAEGVAAPEGAAVTDSVATGAAATGAAATNAAAADEGGGAAGWSTLGSALGSALGTTTTRGGLAAGALDSAPLADERGTLGAYERHADRGEGPGVHAGGVALIVGTSFLDAFNGMQQRAAQVAVRAMPSPAAAAT